jgi:hypothetical protein
LAEPAPELPCLTSKLRFVTFRSSLARQRGPAVTVTVTRIPEIAAIPRDRQIGNEVALRQHNPLQDWRFRHLGEPHGRGKTPSLSHSPKLNVAGRSPPPAPVQLHSCQALGHFASPRRTHRSSPNCSTNTAGTPWGRSRSCACPRRHGAGRAVKASHSSGPPKASGTTPPRSPRIGPADERIPGQHRPRPGSSARAARQPSAHRRPG